MKAILLYLVLVGVPVAGVYGIVCLGQDLKPPRSVAGAWTVELTPRVADSMSCKGFIVPSKSLILKVTQSGPHIDLTLNDQSATRLSGEVKFESLTARSLEENQDKQGAVITSPIQVQAGIDRHSDVERLSGTFTFANCPAGSELAFTASRQPKGASGDR